MTKLDLNISLLCLLSKYPLQNHYNTRVCHIIDRISLVFFSQIAWFPILILLVCLVLRTDSMRVRRPASGDSFSLGLLCLVLQTD